MSVGRHTPRVWRNEMSEEAFEVKEAIWEAVHDLVDSMTKDLSPEDDEEVRQVLTEQFRFWRRMK